MSKDRRVKGCPNPECKMHLEEKKLAVDNYFCPKCGTELMLVCTSCFSEIEDISPNHRKCKYCEAESEAKKEKAKQVAKDTTNKVVSFGLTFGGAILTGAKSEGIKQATTLGKETVKKAVRVIKK